MLVRQHGGILRRIAQHLPVQTLQLRRAGADEQAQAQRDTLAVGRHARLIEGGAYLRAGRVAEKPLAERATVGCRIKRQLAQRDQVELGRGEIAAYQPHLGVAVRRREAYLNGIALRIVSAQADLQIGEPEFRGTLSALRFVQPTANLTAGSPTMT